MDWTTLTNKDVNKKLNVELNNNNDYVEPFTKFNSHYSEFKEKPSRSLRKDMVSFMAVYTHGQPYKRDDSTLMRNMPFYDLEKTANRRPDESFMAKECHGQPYK